MQLHESDKEQLISELVRELGARRDGTGKNLIAPRCPYCGKEGGKYGIYVGEPTERKQPFMAHCFSCGHSTTTLAQLLQDLGRMDLLPTATADPAAPIATSLWLTPPSQEEINDTLSVVELPDFYRRRFSHPYLKARGFTYDDYERFPVGDTGRLNRRYTDYIIFLVLDDGDTVGYVARHVWSKAEIDAHNRRAKRTGDYKILRYRNSTENEFSKLLYNYDAIEAGVTQTVVLTEGIFDVVALTRSLDLYDDPTIVPVSTFGKKISLVQIYKLQWKGIRQVIVGYDGDAVEATKKTISQLSPYFDVRVADIADPTKDWEELTEADVREIFAHGLLRPLDYKLRKIQGL